MNSDKLNAARYEYVRQLSPVQFAEIFQENLKTGRPFDDLIDDRRTPDRDATVPAIAVHSPIGSEDWFNALVPSAKTFANQLVSEKRRVSITYTDETGEWVWAVYFDATDFWADAFDTEAKAIAYAAAWNDMCPAVAKSA